MNNKLYEELTGEYFEIEEDDCVVNDEDYSYCDKHPQMWCSDYDPCPMCSSEFIDECIGDAYDHDVDEELAVAIQQRDALLQMLKDVIEVADALIVTSDYMDYYTMGNDVVAKANALIAEIENAQES